MFADDTVICVAGNNFGEVTHIMNEELDILYDWLCKNKLKLNTSKTKSMVMGTKSNCKKYAGLNLTLYIDGSKIDFVSEIKYLGVILDPQLNFSLHINYICKKLGKKIGFFARISKWLSLWTKKLVFNTIILPHFNYCSALLISCTQEDIYRLQLQQNKAMRIILSCNRYTPIEYMLKSLNWLSVEKNIKKANVVLIYKIENGLVPKYLECFFREKRKFAWI